MMKVVVIVIMDYHATLVAFFVNNLRPNPKYLNHLYLYPIKEINELIKNKKI